MGGDDRRDEETYAIIGAAMAVHNDLGCGFLARFISRQREFLFQIPYTEKKLAIRYKK